MRENLPDTWVLVEVSDGQTRVCKVFAGWYGGYGGSDSWKLSSAIVSIQRVGDWLVFSNASGSRYKCNINNQKMSGLQQSLFIGWIDQLQKLGRTNLKIVDPTDPDFTFIPG